jgi:TonB family protein
MGLFPRLILLGAFASACASVATPASPPTPPPPAGAASPPTCDGEAAKFPAVSQQVLAVPKNPSPNRRYLVKMRVRVGREGKVTGVRVEENSGEPDYAAAATHAMFRFLFEPGKDAAGRPLECEITYHYRWEPSRG